MTLLFSSSERRRVSAAADSNDMPALLDTSGLTSGIANRGADGATSATGLRSGEEVVGGSLRRNDGFVPIADAADDAADDDDDVDDDVDDKVADDEDFMERSVGSDEGLGLHS